MRAERISQVPWLPSLAWRHNEDEDNCSVTKCLLAVLMCSVCAWAWADQEKGCPLVEEGEVARLQALADQVKEALANGNLAAGRQLASELARGVSCREKLMQFRTLDAQIPAEGVERIYPLVRAAHAAYDASDYLKAETYARELISLAEKYPEDDATGSAIFSGHTVLGRVALGRDHNVADAKAALLASGKTRGSRTLRSFGPNMSLARDLLMAGERDAVLQFFEECRAFWKGKGGKLDEWAEVVRGCCRLPEFGANFVYY